MKKLIFLIALLLATRIAHAGSYTIDFMGFQQGGWQEGYPYFAGVNGGPVIDVMCDDYAHGGGDGETWLANFTNLGSGNTSLLRFNQMNGALTLYEEAGWILLQTLNTPQNQWTDMNSAVWHIFDSAVSLDQGAQNWLNMAQHEAKNGFQGINFNQVGIYTPLNQYDPDLEDPQELMTLTATTVLTIPEPSALSVLLGAGLVGWAGFKLLS